MVLWTPPSINYLPPDLKPPGFKHYKFSDDGPLSLPMGGITYDGLVYIRGTRTMASEDIPTRACIVKGGRARKHHIVETQDLPPSDSSSLGVTPMCCQSNGHSVRRWQRVVQEELPLMICTKAEWGNGGLWCYPCIEALRAKIVPLGLNRVGSVANSGVRQGVVRIGALPGRGLNWASQGQRRGRCKVRRRGRAGKPSGHREEASPQGLGGHQLLAQTDARCPNGPDYAPAPGRPARRRWRRSGPRGDG